MDSGLILSNQNFLLCRAMRNRGVEIYMGAQSYSRNENGGEEINDPDDQTTVGK